MGDCLGGSVRLLLVFHSASLEAQLLPTSAPRGLCSCGSTAAAVVQRRCRSRLSSCGSLLPGAIRRCCARTSPDPPLRTLVVLRPPVALIRALPHLRWYSIVLHDTLSRLLASERCSIDIAQFIRFVSAQHRQHPIKQVGRTRTHRLLMVLALAHHLIVVDGGDLRIVAAGNFRIQIRIFLDQIRPGLGQMQALRFTLSTLIAHGHHASPAPKQAGRAETARIADKTGIDGCTVLTHPFECFQVPAGMYCPIERPDCAHAQRVVLLLQPCQPGTPKGLAGQRRHQEDIQFGMIQMGQRKGSFAVARCQAVQVKEERPIGVGGAAPRPCGNHSGGRQPRADPVEGALADWRETLTSARRTIQQIDLSCALGLWCRIVFLEALDQVRALADRQAPITTATVLLLHRLMMDDVLPDAGQWRVGYVHIRGATYTPPHPREVPQLMADWVAWLDDDGLAYPPVLRAALAHVVFEVIHPFSDGNGRVGRLLLNLMLMREGYPPALLPQEWRTGYIHGLHLAQTSGNHSPIGNLIGRAVEQALDRYLESIEASDAIPLPLSEVAERTGERAEHLAWLIRKGRLSAVKRGRRWFATVEAVERYRREVAGREIPRGRPPAKP